jgi:hypothetical protein
VRKTVTTRAERRLKLAAMKKRLFIGVIFLALLILAALGAIIGTGGD